MAQIGEWERTIPQEQPLQPARTFTAPEKEVPDWLDPNKVVKQPELVPAEPMKRAA